MGKWISAYDLAELVGKSQWWVISRCRSGELPHQKVGRDYRFTPAQVDEIRRMFERRAREAETAPLPGVSPRSRSPYAKSPP